MKGKWVLLLLLSLKSFNLFSQQSRISLDSILWDKDVPLKWSDFEAKPDTLSKWIAVCPSSIYVKGFRDGSGLPNFQVTNSFIKKDAWSKDTISINVLQHEQLHFDLGELYARKIRQAVDSLRQKKVKAIEAYSDEIRKLLRVRNETGALYDEQTNHGTYGNQQSEWNKKILNELESLKKYID